MSVCLRSRGPGLLLLRRLSTPASGISTEARKIQGPSVRAIQSQGTEELKPTTLQIGAVLSGVAILAKLAMMYDEELEPERVAKAAREFAQDQETLEPMTREKWDYVQNVRPHTPFESKIARNNARIRTSEQVSMEDVCDWALDVVVESLLQREDAIRRRNS